MILIQTAQLYDTISNNFWKIAKENVSLSITHELKINLKSSILELSALPTNPSHLITIYKSKRIYRFSTYSNDKKSIK